MIILDLFPKLKFLNGVYYILVPLYGIQYLRISETVLVYKILNFCLNVICCNINIILLMCQIIYIILYFFLSNYIYFIIVYMYVYMFLSILAGPH